MPSKTDQRRLNDGENALDTREPPGGADLTALERYKELVGDAIAALQSLDDLGDEMNQRAFENEKALWVVYDRIKARIAAHG
jgi:hypothetical protein